MDDDDVVVLQLHMVVGLLLDRNRLVLSRCGSKYQRASREYEISFQGELLSPPNTRGRSDAVLFVWVSDGL